MSLVRKSVLLLFAGALLAAAPDATTLTLVRRAVADPGRAAQRVDDPRRHPVELVALAELRPGQRVLELIPGTGYWTRIFSKIVGPRGRVYAVWPEAYGKVSVAKVQMLQAMSASRDYANVVTQVQPNILPRAPEPLDLVWTADNYHDYNDKFMGNPGPAAFAKAVHGLLKPDGRFIVIDHAAARGRGMQDTEALHRIERATVIAQVTRAGFRLVGESAVLANPADPLDIPVFDPKIRGKTSQFALVFRKTGK